jgi:transcriptional regulator with XRE-family HTH domain
MALDDLGNNLKLLCGYGRSVSDVCRRSGINRQQFNRYLSGKTKPSLRSVRRICDFFGIDDHEIFLDHHEFSELIRLRPPRIDQHRNPLHGFFERMCQSPDQVLKDAGKYTGYYYFYFQPNRQTGVIYKSLMHFYREGDLLLSKQLERFPNSEFSLPRVMKHEGVIYGMSDRLVLTEREETSGSSLWHSIFYSSDYFPVTFLSGLSMGITPESSHGIVCCRSVLENLGKVIDVRNALKKCGSYDPADAEISEYVLRCIQNDISDTAAAFTPRS